LSVFLSVSEERTFAANSPFPNEGIGRMARKNGGASAKPNTMGLTKINCNSRNSMMACPSP
jgi:hypothetical protein